LLTLKQTKFCIEYLQKLRCNTRSEVPEGGNMSLAVVLICITMRCLSCLG